ncbi:MAG: hypothetical protein ACR2PM_14330 [Hyphomicrobiales bacterium]
MIDSELGKILCSDGFAQASNLKAFLNFVVRQAVECDAPNLKEYTIATRCFGKPVDFDAQLDPIVRVQARKLRDRLDTYYAKAGQRSALRIELPKGSYVPRFDFRSHGEANGCATAADEPTILQAPSIAVVPFEVISGSAELKQLSAAVAEEIAVALACFEDLNVLATTERVDLVGLKSGSRKNPTDYLLTGTLRNDGATVRVTASLVRVTTAIRIWSASYDFPNGKTSDVRFHVELAARIAETIAQPNAALHWETIRRTASKPLDELNGYECLVQSYPYEDDLSLAGFARAISSLERGTQLLPENSVVWANLALVYCDGYRQCYGIDTGSDEMLEKAYNAAQLAVKLNPMSGFARLALSITLFSMGNYEAATVEGKRAIDLNPHDASILAEFGFSLAESGQWAEGAKYVERAAELNPLHPDWYAFTFVYGHYAEGNFETALCELNRIRPNDYAIRPLAAAMINGQLGKGPEAGLAVRELKRLRPDIEECLDPLLARHNFPEETSEKIKVGLRKAGMKIT